MFYEIKDKIRDYEEMEYQLENYKKTLEEKTKQHRMEINKR